MKKLVFIFMFIVPLTAWSQLQIDGLVLDDNGNPVVGASVVIRATGKGSISDVNGKFKLTCPEPCSLEIAHVNFESITQQILQSGSFEFQLVSKDTFLDELQVEGSATQDISKSNIQKIESVSALFGEKDILKYLITLPGISSISTFDAGISVRGGSTSENAFLIESMPIADPRHLTTLVTSYDPYILGNSSIYRSGQPVQYNGYLSGYVDMSPALTYDFKPQAELSVGLISSSLKAKTVLGKSKHHAVAISARQSYLRLIAKMYEQELEGKDILPDYSLRDMTFAYQGKLRNDWQLSAVGLLSSDDLPIVLNENQSHQLNWNTASSVLSVDKKFTNQDRLSLKISANESEASDASQGRLLQSVQSDSRSYSGSIRYKKNFNDSWKMLVGIQHERKEFEYFDNPDTSNPNQEKANRTYDLSSIFVGGTHFLDKVTIEGGVNLTHFNGDAIRTNISPRLKIHYLSNWEIWMDYARTLQFEERLPFFTIRSPIDMPIPLGENDSPAISDQVSLGVGKTIFQSLSLSTSVFYKKLSNLKDFANSSRSNLDFISIEMIEGHGHAYGLESELSYSSDKFQSQISYTLLRSKRQFDQINDGREFSPPYDVTNSITLQANYQFNEHWSFGTLWTYTSGIFITIPEGIAVAKDITRPGSVVNYVPIYNERYNYQLPARHRLDLSLDYKKKFEKNAMKLSAGTYNTYDRKNVDFVYLEVQQADEYLIRFVPKSKLVLPFVPYVSLTFYLNNHGS